MEPGRPSPPVRAALIALLATFALAGCGSKVRPVAPGTPAPRTWRMGFSAIPPRADFALLLAALDLWTRRADAAIVHEGVPWDSLLAGVRADSLVVRQKLGLIQYYRGRGLRVVYTIDPTDGLNRAADDPALVAAGRSLTEPAIQQLYRAWVVAVDTLLHPDQLGLAAETNLIRAAAPAPLYAAVKQAANDAAADVRVHDTAVSLYVSAQVEVAWGALGGTGTYQGIAQDLADFPFMQALGLSSYPYFAFSEPEDVPLDYYARVAQGTGLSPMVVEGGWTSASLPSAGITSSPAKQARYLRRQIQLLDQARASYAFQLTFTDLDLTGVPLPPGSILPLFATLGLVDATLVPKPALAPWDSAFARPRL